MAERIHCEFKVVTVSDPYVVEARRIANLFPTHQFISVQIERHDPFVHIYVWWHEPTENSAELAGEVMRADSQEVARLRAEIEADMNKDPQIARLWRAALGGREQA